MEKTYRKTLNAFAVSYELTHEDIEEYLEDEEDLCGLIDYADTWLSPSEFEDFLSAVNQYQ